MPITTATLLRASLLALSLGAVTARGQVIVADLRSDYDTPLTAHTDGETSAGRIPDTLGTGSWNFFSSDTVDPTDAAANLTLLTFTTSGDSVRAANSYVSNGFALELPAWSGLNLITPPGSEGTPAANELAVHPGQSIQVFAVAAWTSGVAGTVEVSGAFRDLGATGNGTTLDIFLNSTPVFSSGVTSGNTPIPFSQSLAINAADTVFFVVGSNGDFGADQSALSATIAVPEPATFALLALGIGLVALRRRRA